MLDEPCAQVSRTNTHLASETIQVKNDAQRPYKLASHWLSAGIARLLSTAAPLFLLLVAGLALQCLAGF